MLEIPLYNNITVGDLAIVVTAVLAAYLFGRVLTVSLKRALLDKIPKGTLNLFLKIMNIVIVVIAFLLVLPTSMKVDLTGLLFAGGLAGVILGFASQSVVANLVSGIFLIFERPITIGDNIHLADISGTVEDIQLFSTIVQTYEGIYVRIPNEKVFTSNITNYVKNPARRFEYTVGIRYRDDAGTAIRIIREVIAEHPFALVSPEPSVYVDALADSSVTIVVRIWAPSTVWWTARTDLLLRIKLALEAGGIEMPFPQQTVWFGDGTRDPDNGKDGQLDMQEQIKKDAL
jgi:small-conductance mechanosensitive channel